MLIHIDMDAFFASVEQAINPSLKGKPLIVGSRPNKYHTVVCAASYQAKRLGINSGMPTRQAFLICPELEFVTTDSDKYLYVSKQIFQMLEQYPCQLQCSSIDEFDLEFYDKYNLDHILLIAKEIKQNIKTAFDITCSIGIAPNWQLAKLGSKIQKPNGLVFIGQNNYLDILNGLPIEKICGVGPALKIKLNMLGINTCDQLINYPKQILISKFGKVGYWLANCLNPKHNSNLRNSNNNPGLPKSIGHSYTLHKETSNHKEILAWLRLLSEMVAKRLRELNLEAKTLHIWINNYTIGGFSKQRTYQDTIISLGIDIFMRSIDILGLKNGKKISIRALGLSVTSLTLRSQLPLLDKEIKHQNLTQIIDKINEKYGDWTVYPATLNLIHNSV